MHRPALALLTIAVAGSAALAAGPKPEETWPGFRGHGMSGIAPSRGTPDRWSKTENVRWKVAIPGQGWSSPIVWGDTVFITSGISKKPFKQPSPGLYGNDYIAELQKQGLSDDEVLRRVRARDNETPDESDEIRYVVYALDAKSGKVKWEREAITMKPSGGRHRKNTYASETPFTDGERLYVSFGQNVGLFCYTLDGKTALEEAVGAAADLSRLRHRLVADRPRRSHLSAPRQRADSYITALEAKNGDEIWRTARPRIGLPKSSWTTPFVWDASDADGDRDARVTDDPRLRHSTARSSGVSPACRCRPRRRSRRTGALRWQRLAGRCANRPFLAIKPGASGDITLAKARRATTSSLWRHPRVSGYTPSASCTRDAPISCTTPASSRCSTRRPASRSTRFESVAVGTHSRRRPSPPAIAFSF